MKLDRFRAPALAAAAVLMISGAGIAFAGNPASSTRAAAAPVTHVDRTGSDTDNVQQGDQTTPDNHGGVASVVAKAHSTTGKAHGAAVSTVARTNVAKSAAEGSEAKGTEPEGAADAAAQHAACLKAGIDDTLTPNVQYDDASGACSLDAGGTDNNGE